MNSAFTILLLPFIALICWAGAMMTHGDANPLTSTVLWVLGIAAFSGWLWAIRHDLKALFEPGRSSKGRAGLNMLLTLAILVALGYLSGRARFNGTYDASRNLSNTLSAQTLKVVSSLNASGKTVEVTGFFQNEILQERFKALLSLYQNAGLSTAASYFDPELEPAKAIAAKITNANTVVVKLGDKENRMTAFTEERLTNSLISVLKEKTAKIYFSQGHGEGQVNGQNADDFELIAGELKGNKYDLATFSIMDGVPADADLIVIAGIKYDLKAAELKPLRAYLRQGKPLLVLVDALVPVKRLNSLLEEFGLSFADNFLMLRSDDQRAQLLGTQNAIVSQFDGEHPVTKDFAQKNQMALLMPYSRSVATKASRYPSIKAAVIARTADGVVGISEAKSQRSLKNIAQDRIKTGPFDVIAVATGTMAVPEQKPPADSKEKGKDQQKGQEKDRQKAQKNDGAEPRERSFRMIVAGSSRFATNQGAQRAEHRDMLVNMVNYLVQDDDYIAIRPNDSVPSSLKITDRSSVIILALLCFVYPFIVLGAGIFHSYRRRKS